MEIFLESSFLFSVIAFGFATKSCLIWDVASWTPFLSTISALKPGINWLCLKILLDNFLLWLIDKLIIFKMSW